MNISDVLNYEFLFDSHVHLTSKDLAVKVEEVVKQAEDNGVKLIFDIGTSIETSLLAIENSRRFKNVRAYIGIDPEVFEPGSELFIGLDKDDSWFEEQKETLSKLIVQNIEFLGGIGETGMDFHWLNKLEKEGHNSDEIEQSKVLQEKLFRLHLELAQEVGFNLSIHSRRAEDACLQIVREYKVTGIFHSYTGDYKTAKGVLDSGWGLGVNGIITFKNAKELREVYKKLLGKIPQALQPKFFYEKGVFFETDSPYLSPEGKRGAVNEPSNIKDIYEQFVKLLTE